MNKFKTLVVIAAVILMVSMIHAGNREAPKAKAGATTTTTASGTRTFIDENGDGICDNWSTRPQDGSGNKYRRGRNQNGNGPFGTGICDGSGPHGSGRRGGAGRRS